MESYHKTLVVRDLIWEWDALISNWGWEAVTHQHLGSLARDVVDSYKEETCDRVSLPAS